ncbi:Hypothetical predicted protein [Mytilus galloprovincialis]|uniref:Uncharacterized protein n=1 Tax=Mytilus galloprovincialis TaxID=29158 RepID=A0A8B6DKS0_MYTGA|nr:Hypothetical predicted protein [Mytilus galloprovincialis]
MSMTTTEVVGEECDTPALTEQNREENCGNKKQKNRPTFGSKQQWINYADANEEQVIEYIRNRPNILAKLQLPGILSETEVSNRDCASVCPYDLVDITPLKPLDGLL